jgi:hypothetical protein
MSMVNIGKESLEDSLLTGHGTVGTDEAKISEVNFPVAKHIVVRAASGNGNTITVGRPGQAANGFVLAAGEQTPPMYVTETDKVRVIGGAADQDYSWIAN